MRKSFLKIPVLVCLCLSMTGCSATARHAFKGAVAGAAVGATIAALSDKNLVHGALLGAGAGAAIGAVTTRH